MTATIISNDDIGSIPTNKELSHRQAIHDILFTHSRGLDRGNPGLLKSAYWPDAEVDYGGFKGSAHQFADMIVPVLKSAYELTQHKLGQSFIRFEGLNAKSESYITARHLLLGAKQHMIFFGRYLDQFECRASQWKITHRQVVMDWSRTTDVIDERNSEAFTALAKGSMNQQDPATYFFNQES